MTKRFFSALFALVLILPMLLVPVFAEETINDLTKIYNNLSNYLHKPYFEDSQYFDEYEEIMEELDALLKTDSVTQAEIVQYYNDLRTAFSRLMRDTFDYSSVESLILSYQSLPSTLFTEESWKKMVSIHDSAQKELEAPTLFFRASNDTKDTFRKKIQSHVATFMQEFVVAFDELEMIEAPEAMTKEYLADYAKFIRFCAREELLGETEAWPALLQALSDADAAVAQRNPRQARLDRAYEEMNTHFAAASSQGYDFTEARKAITDHSILVADRFSAASWARYENEIHKLEAALTSAHVFFIPIDADKKTCEAYAASYVNALPKKALSAHADLVSLEDYQKLLKLCQEGKNRSTMEGLDIKLASLKKRVKEGEEVLANENATGTQVQEAIQNIESASHDLTMAEGYLREEQDRIVKQDAQTIRYTVIFTVASVLLAAGFAMILSRYYFGKVNWTR